MERREDDLSESVRVSVHGKPGEAEALTSAVSAAVPLGESAAIRCVLEKIRRVAASWATILLLGESGSGKGCIAEHVHRISPRASKPFVEANCGTFSETLIESELYGHEKGAFTGAVRPRAGRFELARDGTIFLDEIGDLSEAAQIKLLRVLQARRFERVGGSTPLPLNARVVAATHCNLDALMKKGKFREDMFHRLNVITIHVPALRDRREDIPILARAFVEEFSVRDGKPTPVITPGAMDALRRHSWPGNVRGLRNCIEGAVAFDDRGEIDVADLPAQVIAEGSPCARSDQATNAQKTRLLDALKRSKGNKAEAERLLGICHSYFYRLLRKHGIT